MVPGLDSFDHVERWWRAEIWIPSNCFWGLSIMHVGLLLLAFGGPMLTHPCCLLVGLPLCSINDASCFVVWELGQDGRTLLFGHVPRNRTFSNWSFGFPKWGPFGLLRRYFWLVSSTFLIWILMLIAVSGSIIIRDMHCHATVCDFGRGSTFWCISNWFGDKFWSWNVDIDGGDMPPSELYQSWVRRQILFYLWSLSWVLLLRWILSLFLLLVFLFIINIEIAKLHYYN